jgi:hypothetical protein
VARTGSLPADRPRIRLALPILAGQADGGDSYTITPVAPWPVRSGRSRRRGAIRWHRGGCGGRGRAGR